MAVLNWALIAFRVGAPPVPLSWQAAQFRL
jgi:hypothetical protein